MSTAQHARVGGFLTHPVVDVAYALLTVVLTVVAVLLWNGHLVGFGVALFLLGVLLLGPLGATAVLLIDLPIVSSVAVTINDQGSGYVVGAIGAGLVAAIVAGANVVIVRHWVRLARRREAELGPPARRATIDRSVAAILFGFAGAGFILLCIIAGAATAFAHGVDGTPEPHEARTVLVATIAWFSGLLAAVGGLVIWIVMRIRHRRVLAWAIADLAIVVAADVAVALAVGNP